MTAETNAAALAADFNRYFTSANEVAPNARISVPTSEWQALYAALLRAGAAKAPEHDADDAAAVMAMAEKLWVILSDVEDKCDVSISNLNPDHHVFALARAALATPPAPDAGVVEPAK